MIVYKDKSFCPLWIICKDGVECNRALTEDIRAGAKELGLPIAQFSDQPECFNTLFTEDVYDDIER